MGLVFSSVDEAVAAAGSDLGASEWLEIDQARIDAFADATGDHQWIHVDPERAKDGPFGRTVAHGYLTFSLINMFLPDLIRAEGATMGLNYGADRLRFPAAVPVGSRIRFAGTLAEAKVTSDGGVQLTTRVTVELEGSERPACVADILSRYYF